MFMCLPEDGEEGRGGGGVEKKDRRFVSGNTRRNVLESMVNSVSGRGAYEGERPLTHLYFQRESK